MSILIKVLSLVLMIITTLYVFWGWVVPYEHTIAGYFPFNRLLQVLSVALWYMGFSFLIGCFLSFVIKSNLYLWGTFYAMSIAALLYANTSIGFNNPDFYDLLYIFLPYMLMLLTFYGVIFFFVKRKKCEP